MKKKSINSSTLSLLYDSTITSLLWELTTGETITLSMWTFADKMVSLLFNMQSSFVIAFLPTSKCVFCFLFFLISWLQPPFSVILEPKKIKFVTASTLVWQYNTGYVPWCFPGDSVVKNLPAVQETRVQSLDQEDPWRRDDYPLQYSCLEDSMREGLQSMESKRTGHDWGTEHAST